MNFLLFIQAILTIILSIVLLLKLIFILMTTRPLLSSTEENIQEKSTSTEENIPSTEVNIPSTEENIPSTEVNIPKLQPSKVDECFEIRNLFNSHNINLNTVKPMDLMFYILEKNILLLQKFEKEIYSKICDLYLEAVKEEKKKENFERENLLILGSNLLKMTGKKLSETILGDLNKTNLNLCLFIMDACLTNEEWRKLLENDNNIKLILNLKNIDDEFFRCLKQKIKCPKKLTNGINIDERSALMFTIALKYNRSQTNVEEKKLKDELSILSSNSAKEYELTKYNWTNMFDLEGNDFHWLNKFEENDGDKKEKTFKQKELKFEKNLELVKEAYGIHNDLITEKTILTLHKCSFFFSEYFFLDLYNIIKALRLECIALQPNVFNFLRNVMEHVIDFLEKNEWDILNAVEISKKILKDYSILHKFK